MASSDVLLDLMKSPSRLPRFSRPHGLKTNQTTDSVEFIGLVQNTPYWYIISFALTSFKHLRPFLQTFHGSAWQSNLSRLKQNRSYPDNGLMYSLLHTDCTD